MKSSLKKKSLLLILYLISFLILYNFPFQEVFKWKFLPSGIKKAEAGQITIDSNVLTTDTEFQRDPNVVFLENTAIGYVFGPDSDGTCVYWKTTNGGIDWGAAVALTAQTDCLGTTVWYDRWTPGDTTGNFIHIVFAESGGSDLYYERLDTTDDSQLGETDATTQGATLAASNSISITKATDGDLYLGTSDTSDSYVVKCTGSCGTASNWTEAGTNPMDADEDEIILRPLASGNIMLVNWDISAHWIRSKIYTDSSNSWAGSWSNIIAAVDNTSAKHAFDITINLSNNNLYFCAGDDTSKDVFTGIYDGTSWSTTTATIVGTMFTCSLNYDPKTNYIWLTTVFPTSGSLGARIAIYLSTDLLTTLTYKNVILSGDLYPIKSNSLNLIGSVPYVIGKDATADALLGSSSENLVQTSYRWQNDDNSPNSNTNMANATTSVSNVKIGQRLTARIQVANAGDDSFSTTTIFSLQFTSDVPTSSSASWTDVGPYTAISYATGTSSNGTAITSQVAGAPTSYSWRDGTWHETTYKTGSFTLNAGYNYGQYTEFGFMIHTANAAESTTYYLRLFNYSANRPLNAYAYYPTLTTVSTANNTKRYSKKTGASLPTGTGDLEYYLDDLGYTYVAADDGNRDSIGLAGQAPIMMFVEKNSNSTDQIDVTWNGQTNTACDASRYMKLQVYRFGSTNSWLDMDTSTTCSANTDFNLSGSITSNISEYYSSNWTYWRVYQNAGSAVLRTDQISFTFTAAGSLTMSAPSSTAFDAFTLGSSVPNKETWATGTEQILVSNSLTNGWTLTATCSDFITSGEPVHTIANDYLYFDSDGVTSTGPTIVFTTYVGNIAVTEGPDGASFANPGVPVTIAKADAGEGIGNFYIQPSFDFYIYATSTYSGAYSATLTLTLAYNDSKLPIG